MTKIPENTGCFKVSGRRFLIIASFPESLVNFRGFLIDALLEEGYEVHAAAPEINSEPQVYAVLSEKGVRLHDISLQRTGLNPFRDLKVVFELMCLMRRIKPACVLSYTIKPVVYGSIAAACSNVPTVVALVTGLGYAFTMSASRNRALLLNLVRKLYSFALHKSDIVFFQNSDDKKLFERMEFLADNAKVYVVNGSGVHLAQYSAAPLPEAVSFLLIARLLGDKGIREFALAASRVKARYPDVSVRLVGWMDDNPDSVRRDELNSWISDGTVEFLGRLSDVRPAIANSSVYVLPSYREGTPRTVLEAMSMGRPIITTDAPGCRETVVDGDNGYLVPVGDAEALAQAMLRFIEQPELIAKMGKRSREIAEEKYDVHKVNDAMLKGMGIR